MSQQINEERQQKTFQRLQGVLINMLKIMREKNPENRPKIEWETDLMDDLGVDSLESIDLMNAIEEEFQVSPSLNEANTKRTVAQIVQYIIELEDQQNMKG